MITKITKIIKKKSEKDLSDYYIIYFNFFNVEKFTYVSKKTLAYFKKVLLISNFKVGDKINVIEQRLNDGRKTYKIIGVDKNE